MKWEKLQRSRNVVDQRGRRSASAPVVGGSVGVGGVAIVLLISFITGQNPLNLLNNMQGQTPTTQSQSQVPTSADEDSEFTRAILGSTEQVWGQIIPNYPEPKLVLFSDAVNSACGMADSAVGPFYCPADSQVYIDLTFFQQLGATAGEENDFARAYVIAHEVGHHVQNVLGTSRQVQAQRRRVNQSQSNQLSVRLELQADCYAGVWAHYIGQSGLLERGDIEEALAAAHAVGDDTLQRQARGRVMPDSFTHGSAEQRQRWFAIGMQTGDPQQCDTFSTNNI